MSTSMKKVDCGYVTINAAFLQEVKEAFAELWERIGQMEQAARRGLPLSVDLNHWVTQLSELREQLAREFSLEETYGYVTNAAHPFPGATMAPSMTRNQHAELYLHLSELCEQVEEAQYRGTLLRDFTNYAQTFYRFSKSLQEHESHESRLIEQGLGIEPRKN